MIIFSFYNNAFDFILFFLNKGLILPLNSNFLNNLFEKIFENDLIHLFNYTFENNLIQNSISKIKIYSIEQIPKISKKLIEINYNFDNIHLSILFNFINQVRFFIEQGINLNSIDHYILKYFILMVDLLYIYVV